MCFSNNLNIKQGVQPSFDMSYTVEWLKVETESKNCKFLVYGQYKNTHSNPYVYTQYYTLLCDTQVYV